MVKDMTPFQTVERPGLLRWMIVPLPSTVVAFCEQVDNIVIIMIIVVS